MNRFGGTLGRFPLLLPLVLAVAALPARAQYGVVLSGAGPVNRSVGGTATALPLDSLGALLWNPATLSGLRQSELSIGSEALFASAHVASRVTAGAFGPGVPPVTLAGSSKSDNAAAVLVNLGLAHRPDDSCLTFGMGLLSVGGFSTNYPAEVLNPVLTPPAPRGFGSANIAAELQVFQVVPAVSYQVNDYLSVGVSPILDLALLRSDPFVFADPDDANGDGFATFPGGFHSPLHVGAGGQAGVYLTTPAGWGFGASLKSPQWFEKFRYHTVDEVGRPRRETLRFEFPLIASVGVSYGGIEGLVLGADFRFIDYRSVQPFGGSGRNPGGGLKGVDYDDVYAVSLGAQYDVSDRLSARLGYSFNTNPINGDVTILNVGGAVIIEHTVYTGFTWQLSEHLLASVAYTHAFENFIEGPFTLPQGPVPGTTVRSTVSADAVTLGVTVRY